MAKYKPTELRNIALVGHAGSGKTILSDAMLLQVKAITRLGSIADGSTTSDFEKEEKSAGYSLSSAVMHFSHKGVEFNLIDTPGQTDFISGLISGLFAADTAVICVNANRGIELNSRKSWDYATQMGLAKVLVMTRMDGENVHLDEVMENVTKTFAPKDSGITILPFVIHNGEGSSFKGVTPVLSEGGDEDAKGQIIEAVAMSDDALTEKFLDTMELTAEELATNLPKAVASGKLVPLFYVAAEKGIGVAELMDGLAQCAPSPLEAKRLVSIDKQEGEQILKIEESGPLVARVFKVVSDPHVGKLTFIRVFSGKLEAKSSASVYGEKPERFNQLLRSQGDKREDTPEAVTGDIICCAKVESLHIGDTLSVAGNYLFPPMPYPKPMAGLAVFTKGKGDEQKVTQNLHRLCEEDPTLTYNRDEHTQEQVMRGMGQAQLDIALLRLKNRFGLEVDTRAPKIPYLETITKQNEGSHRHKKQSGGAGQFAEVHMRLIPAERGKGFEFVDKIVGGVISGPFIPSVEKGVRRALEKGPVAGYPVVDVTVELFFGKEHPVDSKDIAFQIAGEVGFKEIIAGCKPVLLEPLVEMEIVFPSDYFGSIQGDISTRRGRPTGTDQMGDLQVLKAIVPLGEAADYASALKAITQGAGSYSMTLSHYEPVPANIAQQVAAKAKAAAE